METKTIYEEGLQTVQSNSEQLRALREARPTKLNKLAYYMLSGYPVTGIVMTQIFNIWSYRDAIYDLRQKGYEISSKIIHSDNGISHQVWWLSMFPEEFAKIMNPTVWS